MLKGVKKLIERTFGSTFSKVEKIELIWYNIFY